jgi:hypothetical protein
MSKLKVQNYEFEFWILKFGFNKAMNLSDSELAGE